MLEGHEICVINGPSSCPKQELEKKVVECGGKIVQNPGKQEWLGYFNELSTFIINLNQGFALVC